jgi:hypothetical protein
MQAPHLNRSQRLGELLLFAFFTAIFAVIIHG